MSRSNFVIGVDYGTDSVHSVIINAANGEEVVSSVFNYPRWEKKLYCDAAINQFRQHPLDYVEGLETSIKDCLQKCGDANITNNIRAISVDTTGSTPVAVDQAGQPLALNPEFEHNPNAMFVLWKDHTALREAAEINEHALNFDINYLKYVGGIYSSEWFWAKLLHILREDSEVQKACYSWVEHCDWIPFMLTGGTDIKQMKRSRCAAGHKGLWSEDFGGLPPDRFFSTIDPLLKGFTERLYTETFTSDHSAGTLSKEWTERLGLPASVKIGVGAFDAHMGAVGGQIVPYHLSKVMGTSTCDILVIPENDLGNHVVKGICGQVNGSVIPGMIGLEAGQSAFGDTYAWFKDLISWPLNQLLGQSKTITPEIAETLKKELSEQIISDLSREAALLQPDEQGEYAVDWLNGRRTPDADQELKGCIIGLSLGSDAPHVFRALVEATCFGAKSIVDRMREEGIRVEGLIGIGGVAKKSPFIMQMMADVMEMPIRIHRYTHTCALGAAMFAAVVAGIYDNVESAMEAMGGGFDKTYNPDADRSRVYQAHYKKYKALGSFISYEGRSGQNIKSERLILS